MRKNIKRVLAVLMAAAMTVSLAACGKGGSEQTQGNVNQNPQVRDGFVWVAEFIQPEVEQSLYNVKMRDNYAYYVDYQYNAGDRQSRTSLSSISLTDGSKGPSIAIEMEEVPEQEEGPESVSRNLSSFMFDRDGKLVTVEYVYHYNRDTYESSQKYYLCRYSTGGQLESSVEFTDLFGDSQDVWIQSVDMDGEGRIYLSCDSKIYLMDSEGKSCGVIDLGADTWVDNMGAGKDGKMYITVYDRESNGRVLKELDFEGKKLGASYGDFIDANYSGRGLTLGMEKDFMGSDSTSLYEYDMESQTKETVLDWLDCDVNSNNINCLYALEDGRIAVLTYDWEKEENKSELAILSKIPASEAPEKINITIASVYSDYYVRTAAVNFNKQNDKYHISIKSYFDYNDVTYNGAENNYNEVMGDAINRLNNDITSNNCPDMLVLDNLNISRYASKGVFEDLNSWLDGSSVLKRSDYYENILECYTSNDILVAIPRSFTLSTLAGRASDLGTEPGWTLQEIMDYANAHPDQQLLAHTDKERALATLLQYAQGNFVDWQSGQCSFDSENFVKVLELANRFPEEANYYNEDGPSYPVLLGKGEILLDTVGVYDFRELQLSEAMFGVPVNYIGYPNENGDSGTYLTPSTGLAIIASSANKEGAWAFLESFLSEDSSRYSYGFPSQKSKFEEAKAEAVKIEYIYEYEYDEDGNLKFDEEGNPVYKLDEEGNPVIALDENGEPMIRNSGGGVGYGNDWSYDYHIPTEEEVSRIEELIRIARPATNSDTDIMNIINEEAQAFFKGQKSAKDVAGVIQSRVQLYVNENR